MDDHYFETRFTESSGATIPPERFRTLPEAMARGEDFASNGIGSIWFHGEPGAEAVEVVRFTEDGSLVDVQNDDGTNYPLDGLTEGIEPGAIVFSLWLEGADGERTPYDFGFDWDGHHSARWQCSRGDGKEPGLHWCAGTITWSNQFDPCEDRDREDDELGGDLHVTYTSASNDEPAEAVIKGAAIDDHYSRDGWVVAAENLFSLFRSRELI